MFQKRNVLIALVILAVVGLIGNHFFSTEDKPVQPVVEKAQIAKKAEKKEVKPPPTHSEISESIAPYTVAGIHALIGDRENTIERILYRARWNLESDTANQKYRDWNKKMRERYRNSIDAKLLSAITLVVVYDQLAGYNAHSGKYKR